MQRKPINLEKEISDLREKLYFLQLAAQNKDHTEFEFILDHLCDYFEQSGYRSSFQMAEQLKSQLDNQASNLMNLTSLFTNQVGIEIGFKTEKGLSSEKNYQLNS